MAKLKSAYTGGLIEVAEELAARFIEQGWLPVDEIADEKPKKKASKKKTEK